MPLKPQLHVDKLLSNVSVQYKNEEYIGEKLIPTVPVEKDSDKYRIYERDFRVPETVRADKGLAKEFSHDYSSSSYSLEIHALKDYVSDNEERNNDIGSVKADTVEALSDALMRRFELNAAALYTTTNWSLNVSLAATAAWNANTTVSNPIPVWDTGAATIIANSGKTPNHGFMTHEAYIAVKNHVSVLDRVKYTSSEVSENMIASLLGLPAGKLYIAKAVKDTSAKGVASSISNFFGDVAFLGWHNPSPSAKAPSCVYNFENSAPRVSTWRDEEREAEGIKVERKFKVAVVASLTGYLIKDVI